LKLLCARLAQDWQHAFGHPVLLVESFVDPQRFRGTCLTLIALAVAAGCKGPHAIAEFAQSLNHGQRGHLRCWPRPGKQREYDVPSERTLRRLLKKVDSEQLKDVLVRWMAKQDAKEVTVAHWDGKVLKNADPAPARSRPSDPPSQPSEIPTELQKPKADKALTLVNVITPQQRLLDPIVVPQDTNEEGAVAAHLPQMDLAGICLTWDAAHNTKANCRQVTQCNGADFLAVLKANQPSALAKAEPLLLGDFPPSGPDDRQRARTDRDP
jgi:hypothetical protein